MAIRHTLVCGASRSGKSEAELTKLVALAKRNDCAIVLIDPHGPFAEKFLLHLSLIGQLKRVIYDRLQDTDRTPSYCWLRRSTNPDQYQRAAEDDEQLRSFISLPLRRRSNIDIKNSPVIERGMLTAGNIYMYQKKPAPLYWIPDLCIKDSPAYIHLTNNVDTSESRAADALRQIKQWASMSASQWDYHMGPAHRILEPVLKSPAFMVRSGTPTFDLGSFLQNKGILILDSSSIGNLSKDSGAIMMGSVNLQVINHYRTKHEGKTVVVMDEAVNASLVGLPESQALAECGKWGLEFHILVQSLNFPTPEITDNVLQNCWRHEWFRQGSPEAAKLAAEDIGTVIMDAYRVHHYDENVRMVDNGYESVRIDSENVSKHLDEHYHIDGKNVSYGHSTTFRARPKKEVVDKRAQYARLDDQIKMIQQKLMTQGPGWRMVRDTVSTSEPEYVPMLREPWSCLPGLPEKKFQMLLQNLKDFANLKGENVYRSPVIECIPSNQPTDTGSAADRLRRKGTQES